MRVPQLFKRQFHTGPHNAHESARPVLFPTDCLATPLQDRVFIFSETHRVFGKKKAYDTRTLFGISPRNLTQLTTNRRKPFADTENRRNGGLTKLTLKKFLLPREKT